MDDTAPANASPGSRSSMGDARRRQQVGQREQRAGAFVQAPDQASFTLSVGGNAAPNAINVTYSPININTWNASTNRPPEIAHAAPSTEVQPYADPIQNCVAVAAPLLQVSAHLVASQTMQNTVVSSMEAEAVKQHDAMKEVLAKLLEAEEAEEAEGRALIEEECAEAWAELEALGRSRDQYEADEVAEAEMEAEAEAVILRRLNPNRRAREAMDECEANPRMPQPKEDSRRIQWPGWRKRKEMRRRWLVRRRTSRGRLLGGLISRRTPRATPRDQSGIPIAPWPWFNTSTWAEYWADKEDDRINPPIYDKGSFHYHRAQRHAEMLLDAEEEGGAKPTSFQMDWAWVHKTWRRWPTVK
jgi:hypothetical protein